MIFDLDGTLVDTNRLHIEAWRRALAAAGYRVGPDRIAIEVGKGGDKVIPAILGQEADDRDGERLRDAHPAEYKKLAREHGIGLFSGALELVRAVRGRGISVALATSSEAGHLRATEEAAGVELGPMFDQVVTSDDAPESKPAPDLVTSGARKLGLSPAQCAMVGDTVWDALSCRDAGVACIGLTCGGETRDRLRAAGARVTYAQPAELLAQLDHALRICSPGSAHLDHDQLEQLMRRALDAAREGLEAGEAPIGCVLARGDASVIASAHNEQNRTGIKTAHAEMAAFGRSAGQVPLESKDLILVSTLEPCVMCTGAAMEAGVDVILFALPAPADSGTRRVAPPQSPESQMPRIIGRIMERESAELLRQFLRRSPRPEQAAYVEQLLASSS
jgi:phosphoglycolate phosphatase-like HAD superfamily hydrolase/tRNA(Arg) A34 adenosine deaminase TadA